MTKKVLYFVLGFVITFKSYSQTQTQVISSGWQFRQLGTSSWNACSVPGNVVTDLLNAKLINNPFYSINEKNLQWIEKENWEYQTIISCDKTLLNATHVELVFEGLDTYSKVYVNDSLVLSANNMFRIWKVNVKRFLKAGGNILKVVFESAGKNGKEEASKLPYTLPEGERIFTRKAQFQYGWDFGPRYAACGIWKPVKLVTWNEVKIESLHYEIKSITDNEAKVDFILESTSDISGAYNFVLEQVNDNELKRPFSKKTTTLNLKQGTNIDTINIAINKPKRWWSRGLGEAYLYKYIGSLYKDQTKIEEASLQIGLRTIELINQNDSIGKSFYFKVNGKPVFIKGANYIPSDIFLRPKTKEEYVKEIKVCSSANMNMLRIWGGGTYGDKDFYNACDENGILVWQDLMFACAMYPRDTNFTENVKREVEDQVRRLRNHPSLALWCGNNENNEGWNNWGWQKQFHYTERDSLLIWIDYKKLFQQIIPDLIKKYDQRPYWESSPSIGWGRKESMLSGDSHYWGVWWGMEPFSVYEKKVGRFMSEYGFQSLPALSTLKTFCSLEDLNLNSPAIKSHQKHKTGFETIQTYLERDYKTPKGLREYIYISQLLQREGMKTAIEAHRRSKPYCMGTLFWQLNDCWPGISWSAIDYFKQPKAFYYALSGLYKTQLLSVSATPFSYEIKCVNDSLINFDAKLVVKFINFKSEVIWKKKTKVIMDNEKVFSISINKNELPAFDTSACYLKAELISSGKTLASMAYFFTKPKQLNLPKVTINTVQIDPETFEISSDFFAKDVYLYDENLTLLLDQNYFDLEPGEKKKIRILENKNNTTPIKLKALVLNNLYE